MAKLRHLARMIPEYADAMEKTGIIQGSNPKEWFGSLYPISIEKWMGIEVFRDGKWIVYAIVNHKK